MYLGTAIVITAFLVLFREQIAKILDKSANAIEKL